MGLMLNTIDLAVRAALFPKLHVASRRVPVETSK